MKRLLVALVLAVGLAWIGTTNLSARCAGNTTYAPEGWHWTSCMDGNTGWLYIYANTDPAGDPDGPWSQTTAWVVGGSGYAQYLEPGFSWAEYNEYGEFSGDYEGRSNHWLIFGYDWVELEEHRGAGITIYDCEIGR